VEPKFRVSLGKFHLLLFTVTRNMPSMPIVWTNFSSFFIIGRLGFKLRKFLVVVLGSKISDPDILQISQL